MPINIFNLKIFNLNTEYFMSKNDAIRIDIFINRCSTLFFLPIEENEHR